MRALPLGVPKIIEFNGVAYRLMGTGRYYLSQSNSNQGRKHPRGLHVAIWEFYSKKTVPRGWHVHHKDGNPHNNGYENLECLPAKEHRKIPKKIDRVAMGKNLERIRPLATAWHRSAVGRQWHREHARKIWEKSLRVGCLCCVCGGPFESYHANAKFCSQRCERKKAVSEGRYRENRICFICQSKFSVDYKYGKVRTCSFRCRAFLTQRIIKARL